jgi:hypothetical protein
MLNMMAASRASPLPQGFALSEDLGSGHVGHNLAETESIRPIHETD